MARVLLLSVKMALVAAATSLAGCIVPVELTPQRTVANSPPYIITSEVDPPQGRTVVHDKGESFPFTVVAEDPDVDDELNARMFRASADGKSRIDLYDIVMTANDASDPLRRRGTFIPRLYCQALGVTSTEWISIRVTDGTFVAQDDTSTGASADVYWLLQCQ